MLNSRSFEEEDMLSAISAEIFLLVGTDIALVVMNSNICPCAALIYEYLRINDLVYTQYGKMSIILNHYVWVSLNA